MKNTLKVFFSIYFIYILFLVVMSLSGCTSTKKTTKTDVNQKLQTEANVKKESVVKESLTTDQNTEVKIDSSGMKALERIEKLTHDFEARLKMYDTNKPVDPATGKPPLASELEISNKLTRDKKTTGFENSAVKTDQKNDIKTDWNKVIDQKLDSAMKANEKLIANTDNKENPANTTWWIWLIVGIAIPVGLWVLWELK